MPLILSSNVIWHAYRLIAETKIFRLGVSLICLSYVKEEWMAKKYNTERQYILQITKNLQAYLQQIINSDNPIQINIKLFTIYEYIIEHEYILLYDFVSHSNNLFRLVLLDCEHDPSYH